MSTTDEPASDVATVLELQQQLQSAKRRTYLTYAGLAGDPDGVGEESLLVTAHVSDLLTRTEQYLLDTGLPAERVLGTPLLSIPVPLYLAGEPHAVFGSADPNAYWHPLAWLPASISTPMTWFDQQTQEAIEESEEEWAMRVALQVTAAGLYDPRAGWIDVLALHGLDTTVPADLERIRSWIGGAHDSILDSIDLAPHIDGTDVLYGAGWARQRVVDTIDAYRSAAWSVIARTLLDDLAAIDHRDQHRAQQEVFATAAVAHWYLAEVPTSDAGAPDYEERFVAVCAETDPETGRSLDADQSATSAAELAAILREIHGDYADAETGLADAETDALQQIDNLIQGKTA
ncbi:MAG: hypothetical protein V4737_09550 [Curtobacterium sp.]